MSEWCVSLHVSSRRDFVLLLGVVCFESARASAFVKVSLRNRLNEHFSGIIVWSHSHEPPRRCCAAPVRVAAQKI